MLFFLTKFNNKYLFLFKKSYQNGEMVDTIGLDSIAKMLIGSNPIFDIK